ncbi:MAG: SAM-dependent methyltransferase [Planctomycetota bacterium]|jgi:tocopherol O-methyltransferase|nr:class I SAM-dependent methyltransferase [Blastopirellula sp.]
MIEFPAVQKQVIRNHYDVSTLFYRLLWGPHIHHGYWEGQESSARAQVQLTERLARLAEVQPRSRVIDIGCGMGGSSVWLARNLQCEVTGVTLSAVQKKWATSAAWLRGVRPRPKFLRADAEQIEFPAGTADLLWSIECTEHLFNKPAFFRRSAEWLRPGGRFALLAWLAGKDPLTASQVEQTKAVCKGMFCPSLGSQDDYVSWFEQAGYRVLKTGLWTRQVEQTWEICLQRVNRSGVRLLARLLGQNHTLFLDHFQAILDAYRSGAMEYGYFVAEKIG